MYNNVHALIFVIDQKNHMAEPMNKCQYMLNVIWSTVAFASSKRAFFHLLIKVFKLLQMAFSMLIG
jgi:hypothetical protein